MKFSYLAQVACISIWFSASSVLGMDWNGELLQAVSDDDLANAEYYIFKGADAIGISLSLGVVKSINMAKLLLKNEANLEAVDPKNGFTALHYAVNNGRAEIVRFFIKKGADVNAKTDDGRTPLYLVLQHDYFLHSNGGPENKLYIARMLCENKARYEPCL